MSAVVIYDSHYGHTEKYARWIANELQISLYRLDEIGALDLTTYDTIVFGGPVFHGRVKIANLVNTLIPALYDKHILLFTVGLHPIYATYFKHICVDNFNYLVQQYGDFFQLRGATNHDKMGRWHRLSVWWIKKIGRAIAEEHVKELEETTTNQIDLVSRYRQLVQPIVDRVRFYEKQASLE